MADIAATLRAGLEARLEGARAGDRPAVRPLHRDRSGHRPEYEVDILKEIFWRPVAQSPYRPVLAEEDVIGTKIRALADRGAPRDLIDVFAASRRWTNAELEEFGRRHAPWPPRPERRQIARRCVGSSALGRADREQATCQAAWAYAEAFGNGAQGHRRWGLRGLQYQRGAGVARFAEAGVERYLAEEGDVGADLAGERVGDRLAAAGAEEFGP